MLNTVIIEDERPARELLAQYLVASDHDIQVTATLGSVQEGIDFFQQPHTTDLIFSDVQLSDGHSFEIFRQVRPQVPVIFITGYDDFMMNAFELNGIAYLLKPLDYDQLCLAIAKYKRLERHFADHQPVEKMIQELHTKNKSRMIVRKGLEFLALRLEDVVLLYTENKLVYVIDRYGKKYVADKPLSEMALELDEHRFFRANRQYLVHIDYIKGFRPFEKVKLLLELLVPELPYQIVISQETAPHFRQWINLA